MDEIMAMAKSGWEKLAAKRALAQKAREQEQEEIQAAWNELQEEIRGGFLEMVRPYVKVYQAASSQERFPEDKLWWKAWIEIEGLAPIVTTVMKGQDGKWKVVKDQANYYQNTHYRVPRPYMDYEFGLRWDWQDTEGTDELDEALAMAQEQGSLHAEMMAREAWKARREKEKEVTEPVYEPLDQQESKVFTAWTQELTALIRQVVHEEAAKAAA
jgi:hypothetical protein